jgi:RHS repeat-associated protein
MRLPRALSAILIALVPGTAFALGGPSPGAVSPQTVKLPAGPGSVRGLADDAAANTFTGQVDYAVPIELPAGLGGLTPVLSLGYDGGLGNGPLGIGWTLSQAGIRRSLRLGVPHYNTTDEIELVGLGAGGQVVQLANGELRIEGTGNAFTGRLVDGGYELTDADGRVYRFGTTAAARKAFAGKVSFWYLEEVRDVAGNTVVYRYTADKGEVYLDAIEWGPVAGTERAFRAALEYEARTDAVVSYRTGFRVESAKRLARVRVWSFGAVQRVVELGYETQFALTRVNSVRVTSGDGSESLPETRFTYAAPQPGSQVAVTGASGWALNLQGTSLFDVDSDGAMDLLRLTGAGHSWRRNTGGQFATAAPMPGAPGAALDQVRLVDLDGDSVAEMVRQQGSQWIVHKLDMVSGSWMSLGNLGGAANVSLAGVAIADVDGDQRMDVLAPYGSQIQLRIGTAAALSAPVTRPAIDPSRTAIQPGNAATSFYDLNGDGLADAIYLASTQFYLYLGKGNGTFEKYKDVTYPWGGTASPSSIRLGDLNRDGLLDVSLVTAGNVAWYRGRANGTFDTVAVTLPRPAGTDASVVVAVADVNGNGSEDLVWSSDAGMWILDMAGPTTAGMLVEIDNGLGQTQRFSYQASTALMFAAELGGAAWSRTMPASIPVAVTQRLVLASGEPARSSGLVVRDGIYDATERRFIGFEHSTESRPDPAAGAPAAETIRWIRRYAPGLGADRVLRGRLISERIEDGAGTVFVETTHDVAAAAVDGLPATDPRLRRAITLSTEQHHHEGQPTALITRIEYQHDGEARVTEARDLGRLDLVGDESITRTQYTTGRSARGVRDRVCETTLHALDGTTETEVSRDQTLFGDDLSIAPLCDAGAGWQRATRQYLASESRWVTSTETAYSASGQPTLTTTGGVTRTLAYDAHGLHPTAETVVPAPGKTLTWQLGWNAVHQAPERFVEADGAATVVTYDGLGRPIAFAREGAAPHLRHVYHATAPRPYVETFTFDGSIDAVPAAAEPWTPTGGWRHSVEVLDSAGEPLFTATRLDATRWLVDQRRQRDAIGRTIAIAETYAWDGALVDLVASALPATAALRTVTYDALDRAVVQTVPTGAQTTHAYRAFETTVTADGMAPVTSFLDGRGRVRRTERTIGGVIEAVEASYDAAGRITAMRLPFAGGEVTHAFTYDSLGRLVFATDPDIGDRTLAYDDAGRLITATNGAGQSTAYSYDGAGRLASVVAADGANFDYHYDDALDATTFAHTAGRLAWVQEPTGVVQHGYDALGRPTRIRRAVNGRTADQITMYAASGLVLSIDDGDGFTVPMGYDAAGRPVQVGTLWELESQDAAGRVLRERYGNGVVQIYERDVLGQPTRIRVEHADGSAIYDATVARNAYGAITTVTDQDAVGADHSAAYTYDGGARLVSATIGSGPAAYSFSYQYDGLQNMIRRDASGPATLAMLTGEYRYGEPGSGGPRGPRQLTSVAPGGGGSATTFDYDAAGRVIRQGTRTLAYNGFDQLISVTGLPGTVTYAYGHDGLRVSSVDTDGVETIRFTPSITERPDGTREIEVRLGDRLIAQVTRSPVEEGGGGGAGVTAVPRNSADAVAIGALVGGLLLVLAVALVAFRRSQRRHAWQLAAASALVLTGCGGPASTTAAQHARVTSGTTYYHPTTTVGPSLLTDDAGSILDERRTEPFGAPVGAIDYELDPHNALNKETDPSTGWSDHGARWLAVDSARWLTPDPPVKAPDPDFMTRPWSLHPYQYVEQNPIRFWDPDGREPSEIDEVRDKIWKGKDQTPGEQVWSGMKSLFTPGISQVDGLKLAISPLQSDRVPTPVKVGYAIIAPPIVAVAGFVSELADGWCAIGDIAIGSARYVGGKLKDAGKALIKPLPKPLWTGRPDLTMPNVDVGEPTSVHDRAVAYDDPPPPARAQPRARPRATPRREQPSTLSCSDPEYATLGLHR